MSRPSGIRRVTWPNSSHTGLREIYRVKRAIRSTMSNLQPDKIPQQRQIESLGEAQPLVRRNKPTRRSPRKVSQSPLFRNPGKLEGGAVCLYHRSVRCQQPNELEGVIEIAWNRSRSTPAFFRSVMSRATQVQPAGLPSSPHMKLALISTQKVLPFLRNCSDSKVITLFRSYPGLCASSNSLLNMALLFVICRGGNDVLAFEF